MNRFLAGSVAWINALMAWLLVAVGIFAGIGGAEDFQTKPAVGAVIGGIAGLFVAFYLCGLLSLFIEIRKELTKIRAILVEERRGSTEGIERSVRGTEPSIK